MSQADTLLNSLTTDEVATYSKNVEMEPHIIIGKDRKIIVPDQLKRIAVQYDHDVETVTFDCPRYWDKHDMSAMVIYINYRSADGTLGGYIAENICVDESDDTIMHFDWTIKKDVTMSPGAIAFLVCIKRTNDEGDLDVHWNSELCQDMFVSKGLETNLTSMMQKDPDILTQLLLLNENTIALNEATMQRATVYVGSGDMPEGYNVQIDPNGHDIDTFPVQAAIESVLPTPSANYRGKFVLVPTDGTDKLYVCVQVDGGYVWRGFDELGNGSGGNTGGDGGNTGGENTGGDSGDSTDTIATLGKAILGKLILGG